jgi:hypothetical protein
MKIKWWFLLAMVVVTFCVVAVGCKGGDDPPPPPPGGDWTTLNVGGGVTITGVKVVDQNPSKISFTKLTDGIKVKGGNYDWCYPVFTVALGGKKLSQFTSVAFKIKAIGGDSTYKPVALLASDSDFTGQMTEYASGAYTGTGTRVVWKETAGNPVAGFGTYPFTATLTTADTATTGTGTIYMVIMLGNNGNAGTEYDITDITFTP